MKKNYLESYYNDDILPDDLYPFEEFDVQGFLESRNCFLKDFKVGDISYAQYLTDTCKAKNQNPKITLVNLQKEQSIITMPTPPPQRKLDRALGFGMEDDGDPTDGGVDKTVFYGFQKQNDSEINWYDVHWNKFKDVKPLPKQLVDTASRFNMKGFWIQPLNVMTFMAYHYTPWTGTPTSIFSTGFWFDDTNKAILDQSALQSLLGTMADGTVNPATNPFYFDLYKRVVVTEAEYIENQKLKTTVVSGPVNNKSYPTIRNLIKVYRQKPWGSHGVYLFWKTWKYFWPDDLKKYTHIVEE